MPCDEPNVLPNDDLQAVRRGHPNILVIGPPTAAADFLPLLLSRCRVPVYEICGADLTRMPDAGTVVLRDPAELDTGAQRELFQWLDAHEGRVQVVSVARAPLYPLVAEGEFSEALFYRLNIVTMHAATVG